MEKILLAVHYEREDYQRQELWDIEKECPIFGVSDLWECPEDAIIGRNLFTTDDYIRALNQGIELAKKGYTGVAYYAEQNEKGD